MTTQYNLTINKDGEALTLTTTDPDSLKRIMALAGINTDQAEVSPCGCGESLEEVEIEEASDRFANSVAGAGGAMRVVGDTVEFGLKGTGAGKPGSALRKPSGMGDNPLADEDLEEAKVPLIDESNMLKEYAEFKTEVPEAKKPRNPYAVGMAQAMKSTGDTPPLKKSTVKKAHDIAKAIGEAHGIKVDEEDTNEGNEFSGELAKAKAQGKKEFEVDGKKYQVKENAVQQLAESEDNPVASAIARRIMMQHTDVLAKHGPQKVLDAIDDVADFVGDVEEIGTSDVSGWVKQVIDQLGQMSESVVKEAKSIALNGKEVDVSSIEIDGVDRSDYPDFSDAYISYATYKDGTELTDSELDSLTDQHGDLVNELAHDNMHGAADDAYDRMKENVDLNALRVLAGVTPTAKTEKAVSPEIAALKALAGI